MNGLIWLRSDIRIDDNPALSFADSECDSIICIYLHAKKEWSDHNNANVKLDFILQNIADLSKNLDKFNIQLCSLELDSFEVIPEFIIKLCKENNINKCYWNNEFGVDENIRDKNVIKALNEHKIEFQNFDDQVVFQPGTILTGQGKPFSVFTPFKKKWIESFSMDHFDIENKLTKKTIQTDLPFAEISFIRSHQVNMELWPAGEKAATQRLLSFLQEKVSNYSKDRNHPIIDGTSKLSPYLAIGAISSRRCLLEALKLNDFELSSGNKGITKWIDELIWREFYKNIMHSFPRVSMNQPFNLATKKIPWRFEQNEFEAWKLGKTGFPLIDAAMHQLINEGWMHNRLRMVVAMFFTKNLLHDWRLGEAYFMNNLIDGDFASNNGGWQWSASTGTDAAPYFRIFNPVTQSQNFDPEGKFIKQHLPQLESLSAKEIHLPPTEKLFDIDYPSPIVELKTSRLRAIEVFKNNK